MKINRCIRFEKEMLDRAEFLNININDVCRDALEAAVKNYQADSFMKELDKRIANVKISVFVPKTCTCGKRLKSEDDIIRLINSNTDANGIHKIGKNKRAFAFNCKYCNTTSYQKIKE